MRRIPSLTALRAFECAVRTGSFTAAARELSVTRPAISKQIRLLEQELDVTIYDRNFSPPNLTPSGQELYGGIKQAFDLIAATSARTKALAHTRDRIRILVERDFAASWLAKRVGLFLLEHPGVSVEIIAEDNGIFRLDEDFSFRIFYGKLSEMHAPDLDRLELCHWVDLPVCSPRYLQALPPPSQITGRDMHLLHDRSYELWERWLENTDMELQIFDQISSTIFNETSLCLAAACSGAGVAIGDSFHAFEHLRDGVLVPPFKKGLRSSEVYALCWPRSLAKTIAEQAFEQWILSEITIHTEMVEQQLLELNVTIVS